MNHTRSIRSLTIEELKAIKQAMRSDRDTQCQSSGQYCLALSSRLQSG